MSGRKTPTAKSGGKGIGMGETPTRPGLPGRGRGRGRPPSPGPPSPGPPSPQQPGSGIGTAAAAGSASPLPGPSTPSKIVQRKSSSIEYSPVRPPTKHSDPFPEIAPTPIDDKGPPDPNRGVRRTQWPVKVRPLTYDEKPPEGMVMFEPAFFTPHYVGVSWHKGTIPKTKAVQQVVIRRIMTGRADPVFLKVMKHERMIMHKLQHKYILKAIGWYTALDKHNQRIQLVVFPELGMNLENFIIESKQAFTPGTVKLYMAQIAQGIAYMHEKNYIHSRIHPSSIRMSGLKHVRLSRLMMCQSYSPARKSHGPISEDPAEFFFNSPERLRIEMPPIRFLDLTKQPEEVLADRARIIPATTTHWDGKKDDVWAFGCVIWFLLTGEYPYTVDQAQARNLLQALKYDMLQERIEEKQLPQDQSQFLLWILKPNQSARPTMEQIVNHPWFQTKHPTSPHNAPHLSTDEKPVHEKSTKEKDFARTFRKIKPYIRDDLVAQFVAKGYAIQHVVGEGGFGAVFKGIQLKPSGERMPIAMKVMKGKKAHRTFKTHHWASEYKIMTDPAFKHPNLVQIFDVFKEIKNPQHGHSSEIRVFVFMELAQGDLYDLIQDRGQIPEEELRVIMVQVVKGLEHLHKNHVAHRDLKPQNVLLYGPDRNIAKLTDYSLVREADSHTISRSIVGTPRYCAPEFFLGGYIRDSFTVDVWALGIVIYECLTGQLPNWNPKEAGMMTQQTRDIGHWNAEYNKLLQQVMNCSKSPQAIGLMRGMLQMKETRLNLKQVKHHPWLAGQSLGTVAMTPQATPQGTPR